MTRVNRKKALVLSEAMVPEPKPTPEEQREALTLAVRNRMESLAARNYRLSVEQEQIALYIQMGDPSIEAPPWDFAMLSERDR
jgi:hypothetical protein